MRKLTKEEFIARSRKVHGALYDYSESEYKGKDEKVKILCLHHGAFWMTPANHYKGQNCPTCAGRQPMDTEKFIQRSREVHGETYDYAKSRYITMQKHLTVTCRQHGDYKTTPERHVVLGQGCPLCGNAKKANSQRKNIEWFIDESRKIHGDTYDYSLSVYKRVHAKLRIICPRHGEFLQTPAKHLYNQAGCPSCGSISSKQEQEVREFVASLGVTFLANDRKLLNGKELDIYAPGYKFALEFCGIYWHSTLSCFHKQPEKISLFRNIHAEKWAKCAQDGVHLVTLFSDEWENKGEVVKKTLRHLLGKAEFVGYAKDFSVEKLPLKHTRHFFEGNHLQGAPSGGVSYCLVKDGKIYAAMNFSHTTSMRGVKKSDEIWELGRFCSVGNIPGAASRLFSHFVREHAPGKIVSYSDNRWFTGAMYGKLGFKNSGDVPPDYTIFHPKWRGRRHKAQFKRKLLPTRIKELGLDIEFDPEKDTRTETDIIHLLGGGKIFDCGKKKWVWSK